MSNNRQTLYTGVTSDLLQRVFQHKNNIFPKSFTAKYGLHKLIYFETLETIQQAIIREKQIKDLNRFDKLKLIEKQNPGFQDLYNTII